MMEQITLQQMSDGEIIKEVNDAIFLIANNILDEKTNTFKPRAINLKLIFKKELDEDGNEYIHTSYQLKNDLQPRTEFIGRYEIENNTGIIGFDNGYLSEEDYSEFKLKNKVKRINEAEL